VSSPSVFTTILPFNAFLHKAYKSKGGLKQDDLRRRREEQQVEIRRQKREENISKRRNFLPSAGNDSDEEIGGGTWDPPVDVSHRIFHQLYSLTSSSWLKRWFLVSSLTTLRDS
jgi:Importin beta binding domain